jgi:acyl carrier protein
MSAEREFISQNEHLHDAFESMRFNLKMNEKIIDAVFSAIDDLNENHLDGIKLTKSIETKLFGKNGLLDSLGLVNLIIAVEQNIQERFSVALTLADEKALARKNSPFLSVSALVEYISSLLENSFIER